MRYEVSSVPRETIDMVWPQAVELIAPALKYTGGREDLVGVYRRLQEGKAQLWAVLAEDRNGDVSAIQAFVITSIAIYPRLRVLRVEFCGGSGMSAWADDLSDFMERFARDRKADKIEMTGRKGWVKILKRRGWEQPVVRMEKHLSAAETRAA